MAKMCNHWSVTTAGGQMCDGAHFPRKGTGCPKNTNSRCEIIPKRKSKVLTFRGKAHMRLDESETILHVVEGVNLGSYEVKCKIIISRAEWLKAKELGYKYRETSNDR